MCFGPLEVGYDYARIKAAISRAIIEKRQHNLWRYRELLPVEGEPEIGPNSGFTPLMKAERLGAELGIKRLYVKDDTVNHPTLSYKDRVVSVAISKAREFGFKTVSCASTGNLATAVAAHAARAGLNCVIFMPEGVESGKIVGSTIYGAQVITIRGNYDDVNRLCSEIADKYGWAFVNINLRPYYTEGAKTFGFEVAEKDGKSVVDRVLAKSPAAEAGLKQGDRIEQAEGKTVATPAALLVQAAKILPGRPLGLGVLRTLLAAFLPVGWFLVVAPVLTLAVSGTLILWTWRSGARGAASRETLSAD